MMARGPGSAVTLATTNASTATATLVTSSQGRLT
jgi:hypothetical protein